MGRRLGRALLPARSPLHREARARRPRAGAGRRPPGIPAGTHTVSRPGAPRAQARAVRRMGGRRPEGPWPSHASRRSGGAAGLAVLSHLRPAARGPGRMAWAGAVRPRGRQLVPEVRPPLGSGASRMMSKTFLLTDEFPPIVTGISRLMGEIARRYPSGRLVVSPR